MASAILNDTHLKDINKALADATEALKEVELAKRAGIDVTTQEAQLKEGMGKLRQIKSVYFPNQP